VKKIIVMALALVLVLTLGTSVALAKGPTGAGKAQLYNSDGYLCASGAADTTGPTFGFVVLNTNGSGDLIVEVSLKGAAPNTSYDIWVNQDPGGCPLDTPTALSALTTNAQGNGNAHVKVARLAGAINFWVSAVGGGQVLRSTAVVLN
jgi:hypothetical protein